MKVIRICPGSGRRYPDWSLGLVGEMTRVGTCSVCSRPVGLAGDADSRAWIAEEHAEIVTGDLVEDVRSR